MVSPRDVQNNTLRAQLELEVFGAVSSSRDDQLAESEVWWNQHFHWLKDRGYLLRQRYSPDWKPSWLGTKRHPFGSVDGRPARVCLLQLWVIEALFTEKTVREPIT